MADRVQKRLNLLQAQKSGPDLESNGEIPFNTDSRFQRSSKPHMYRALFLSSLFVGITALGGCEKPMPDVSKPNSKFKFVPPAFNEPKEQIPVGRGVSVEVYHAVILEDKLIVGVHVRNGGSVQPVDFEGWRDSYKGRSGAKATDDKGNAYSPLLIDAQFDKKMSGRFYNRALSSDYGFGPVTNKRSRVEFLVFDRPATDFQYVELELDASRVGSNEIVKIRMPKTFIIDD